MAVDALSCWRRAEEISEGAAVPRSCREAYAAARPACFSCCLSVGSPRPLCRWGWLPASRSSNRGLTCRRFSAGFYATLRLTPRRFSRRETGW